MEKLNKFKSEPARKAKPKTASIPIGPEIHLVHRVSKDRTHRLEWHDPKQPPKLGPWVMFTETCELMKWRAGFIGPFPRVFKVEEVAARLLDEGLSGQADSRSCLSPEARPM